MRNSHLAILVFILSSCSITASFAQTNSAFVTYNYSHHPTEAMLKAAEKNYMIQQAINNTKLGEEHIQIQLHIKNHESYAFIEEVMQNDLVDINQAKIASGHQRPIYTNLKENQILIPASENLFREKEYIIAYNLSDIEWKLLSETKNILGYQCFKAIGNLKNKKNTVTAWYAPGLSFSFGPSGYGKLPGLILELHENASVFKAQYIEINPKRKIQIIRPEEGQIISSEEYSKKINQFMQSGKQGFK